MAMRWIGFLPTFFCRPFLSGVLDHEFQDLEIDFGPGQLSDVYEMSKTADGTSFRLPLPHYPSSDSVNAIRKGTGNLPLAGFGVTPN